MKLADEVRRIRWAFGDKERQDAIRKLADEVEDIERRLAESPCPMRMRYESGAESVCDLKYAHVGSCRWRGPGY